MVSANSTYFAAGSTTDSYDVNGEALGRYGSMLNVTVPTDGSRNPNFVSAANFNFGYTPVSGS